jgi:hypothetical protein
MLANGANPSNTQSWHYQANFGRGSPWKRLLYLRSEVPKLAKSPVFIPGLSFFGTLTSAGREKLWESESGYC